MQKQLKCRSGKTIIETSCTVFYLVNVLVLLPTFTPPGAAHALSCPTQNLILSLSILSDRKMTHFYSFAILTINSENIFKLFLCLWCSKINKHWDWVKYKASLKIFSHHYESPTAPTIIAKRKSERKNYPWMVHQSGQDPNFRQIWPESRRQTGPPENFPPCGDRQHFVSAPFFYLTVT